MVLTCSSLQDSPKRKGWKKLFPGRMEILELRSLFKQTLNDSLLKYK